MALSVFYRALKSRITEIAQQSRLIAGQGVIQTDLSNRALAIATGPTTMISFLPIEDSCIFSMKLGAAQLIPAGTYTKIALDTLDFDYSSCVDIANSQFTAPADGIYEFAGGMFSEDATLQLKQLVLYKNIYQTKLLHSVIIASHLAVTGHSGAVSLSSGDTVSIYCRLEIAQTLSASQYTFFSGRRIK